MKRNNLKIISLMFFFRLCKIWDNDKMRFKFSSIERYIVLFYYVFLSQTLTYTFYYINFVQSEKYKFIFCILVLLIALIDTFLLKDQKNNYLIYKIILLFKFFLIVIHNNKLEIYQQIIDVSTLSNNNKTMATTSIITTNILYNSIFNGNQTLIHFQNLQDVIWKFDFYNSSILLIAFINFAYHMIFYINSTDKQIFKLWWDNFFFSISPFKFL